MRIISFIRNISCLTGIIISYLALSPCSVSYAETPADANSTPLESLSLAIFLSPKFVEENSVTSSMGSDICDALGDSLREDKGPWGFGLFSDSAECTVADPTDPKSQTRSMDPLNLNKWELRVDLNNEKQASLSLFRSLGSTGEKREAQITVPTSKFLPQLLSNPKIARIIAASLLDQSPLRSKFTKKLLDVNENLAPKSESETSEAFKIPSYPGKLITVSINIQQPAGALKVSAKKQKPSELLGEKNIWIVTKSRGELSSSLFQKLTAAVEVIGKEEAKKVEMSLNAAQVVGRNMRRDAKLIRPFLNRLEKIAELRSGISFSGLQDKSFSTDIEGLITDGSFTNIWLGINFLQGSYNYKVATVSDILGASLTTKSSRTLFLGTLGYGLRWSSDSDHTIFVYPKLEFGIMDWKDGRLISDIPEEYTSTSFTAKLTPGLGAVLGYQSPESWPIQWQGRAGLTAFNSSSFKTVFLDVSAYLPSPIELGSKRGEIFAFGIIQNTRVLNLRNKQNSLRSFSLQANDMVVGGGYRWLWL
jgi:hypothetical protein